MQSDASLPWLALALTPGLASRLSARVLRRFDSPDGVFRATLPDLESCHLPAQVAKAIVKKESFKRAEKELPGVQKIAGCYLLNWTEPEYPQRLLQIYDSPANSLRNANGAPSWQGPGRAIGVLGTGIDVCYPKENKKLYEKVLERGAIISEFPLRNRIVAGMPLGVVVVEGAQYSGSLITARLAMEFGREVFGVPGNATQPVSFAPNQLIKQGAKLATCAEDVIEELPTPIRAALLQAERPEAEQRNLLAAATLNGSEKKLYELLSAEEPVHIDDIVERSGLNSSEVLATLFDQEMKGIIRQLPGKQFSKVLL
jgi:DNA processing protein